MQFLFCLCCDVNNFLEYSSEDAVPPQVANAFECYCVAYEFTFEGSPGTAICHRCFSFNIRNQNTENIVPIDTLSPNNEANRILEPLPIFTNRYADNQIANELVILGRGPVRPFDFHKNYTSRTMSNIFNEFLLESTHPSSNVDDPEGAILSQVVKPNNKRKATTDAVVCSQPKRRKMSFSKRFMRFRN